MRQAIKNGNFKGRGGLPWCTNSAQRLLLCSLFLQTNDQIKTRHCTNGAQERVLLGRLHEGEFKRGGLKFGPAKSAHIYCEIQSFGVETSCSRHVLVQLQQPPKRSRGHLSPSLRGFHSLIPSGSSLLLPFGLVEEKRGGILRDKVSVRGRPNILERRDQKLQSPSPITCSNCRRLSAMSTGQCENLLDERKKLVTLFFFFRH